ASRPAATAGRAGSSARRHPPRTRPRRETGQLGWGRDLDTAAVDLADDLLLRPAPCLGDEARREDESVPEHRREHRLDVLRRRVAATAEERPGARGPFESEAASHRGADRHLLKLPSRPNELDRPAA